MFQFRNIDEAAQAWREDREMLETRGLILPSARGYMPEPFKTNFKHAELAMDAQPGPSTDPNSAVPAWLTNWVDPETTRILFAPNKMAVIFGEEKKGDWTTQTAWFNVVENSGEVSTYGDYNENGSAGANVNWPQRQAYLFQTFIEYGELELARMALARLNWVTEQNNGAALALNKYTNLTYAFGVGGLHCYGALNDPNLPASLTPAPKSYAVGATKWVINGVVVASPNEIFTDIQSLFYALTVQSQGIIDGESAMTIAMDPSTAIALTATNAFNVNVKALLKENFPNITFETATNYAQSSSVNPQGIAAGNLVQLICKSVEGQKTATCAFNEKMRAHTIIRAASSYRQKTTGGTFGAVIKQPFAIASMIGV